MKLKNFDLRTQVHATEDETLIIERLEALFGIKLRREEAMGHWKNPITTLEGSGDAKLAEKYLKKLKVLKLSDILSRCEKNKFFVRLNKEAAVAGRLVLGTDLQLVFIFSGHAPQPDDVATLVASFWKA
ncbi:MAG: hypothetical protein GOV00_01425 [Candidatus Altiarchaeota archaeon]|nr:hypothetical protein [Candidatus Altiarchaeota archaeon]